MARHGYAHVSTQDRDRARIARRERWVALYEEVRRRHASGETLQAISRAMNLAVGTVRKYASAESFPVPEARPLRPSILDPYLAHLQARLAGGLRERAGAVARGEGGRLSGDGQTGAALGGRAPDETGPDHAAQGAEEAICSLGEASRA